MKMIDRAKNIEKDIINWRRDIHKNPEVGLNTPATQEYVKKELEKMGIECKTYKNCSGISAVIGKKEGKVIALRADIDALPIKEETDFEFKSTNGNMHACGHDAHTAMLLGAAKILKENENMLNGKVKLIFQPGEEIDGGAKVMIEEGVLENPKVDALIAQHVAIAKGFESGKIALKENQVLASSDKVFIKIKGNGGHASTPELCIDPIMASAQLINNIYSIVSRELSATDSVALSIVNVKSEQPEHAVTNIIPNYVEMMASVRSLDNNLRDYINERIGQIVESNSLSMRTSYEYKYVYGYPALINNNNMVKLVDNTCNELLEKGSVVKLPKPAMGSEDASYYLQEVPGVYFALVVGDLGKEGYYPLHNPKMKLDEEVLYKGTAVLAESAINYLNEK
ncbi:M20 metallopeptidase family protein [Clostridium senegalense]|uniref:Amidohydrolase n=1 Tax=Clostridium senegalense TaxID=1465809 RepID=A0A6M0H2I0_9CLOT|nr:M20 family metallopeptidase [Clostridium senegalense]NEU04303.1 amidohydrolase [Clostridium senegalense]